MTEDERRKINAIILDLGSVAFALDDGPPRQMVRDCMRRLEKLAGPIVLPMEDTSCA